MSQQSYRKRLKALMALPENQVCSDCPERQPRWASLIKPPPGSPPGALAIGAFCCLECSGSHRRLGVHISFVRSITLDQWKEEEVLAMENGGNQKVNAIFEARLPSPTLKPPTHANGHTRERFIRDKYERRKYFDSQILHRYNSGQLGNPNADESSSESSSESENSEEESAVPRGAARRGAVRAPSEVAKQRAEKIRQRQSGGRRVQVNAQVGRRGAPVVAAPPEVDLLDFGSLSTSDAGVGGGPPPNPPSATPSPTLDLFQGVKRVSNPVQGGSGSGSGGGVRQAGGRQQQNQQDIMSMFQAPSSFASPPKQQPQQQQPQQQQQQPQQQQQQQQQNFSSAYGNGDALAMMQNAMMMNGNRNMNTFAADPKNSMMMMMMGNQQPNMMPAAMMTGNNSANQMMQNQMLQKQMMMNGMNPGLMPFPMAMPNTMMQQQQKQQHQSGNLGSMNAAPSNGMQNSPSNDMMSAPPMGGTPSNLNVMGGASTGNVRRMGANPSAVGGMMNHGMGNPGGSVQVVADGNTAGDSADPFDQFGAFRSI